MKKHCLCLLAGATLCAPAAAAELRLDVEIPRLQVAEYHRPYVAVWIEGGEPARTTQLSVLYDAKKPKAEGNQWLKDLRQWWRRGGRDLDMPVDGITGATPAVGRQHLRFAAAQLGKLAPGDYKLFVEAVREVGGREVLSLPFSWPPKDSRRAEAQGRSELGAIALEIVP